MSVCPFLLCCVKDTLLREVEMCFSSNCMLILDVV